MSIIPYADSVEDINVVASGLFLDKLSGIGGIPRGRITEIWGDEGIGKTSVCLQLVARAQKDGLKCLWADVEYGYEPRYAQLLGVDNSKLGLLRFEFAEPYLDTIVEEVDKGKWDLIILDSAGGIHSRAEAEKTSEEKTIGSQAGLVSKFCRKVVPLLAREDIALVVINHSYTDVMSGKLMTSGGKKLAYHKSFSVRLKSKFGGNALKQGDTKVGKTIIGEVRKNKVAGTEGMELEAQLFFGQGFSKTADLLNDAIDSGVITKKGNSYFLGTEKLATGLTKVRQMLESDAVLVETIKLAYEEKTRKNT